MERIVNTMESLTINNEEGMLIREAIAYKCANKVDRYNLKRRVEDKFRVQRFDDLKVKDLPKILKFIYEYSVSKND